MTHRQKRKICIEALLALTLFLVFRALNASDEIPGSLSVEQELKAFKANPRKFLNSAPPHWSASGSRPRAKRKTPSTAKIQSRKSLRALRDRSTYEEPNANDQASAVVDRLVYQDLRSMEGSNLLKSTLPVSPWSGDYWPVYKGSLAQRYADPKFPSNKDWKINYDFLLENLDSSTPPSRLSPAEKYDLLVGDSNWSLSHSMQEEGWNYYSGPKTVPTWIGYCHGWSIASYLSPRPTHAIQLTGADGSQIPFYPDDIKALQSALWADLALNGPLRFTGGRCETTKPAQDENGRVLDPSCFDTNPATWHLAVVNQIGVAKRSLTFDSVYDAEVWNQPILGYEYSYFNPNTMLPALNLADATTQIEDFTRDRFSRYRSSEARSVVGISMTLTYLDETHPSPQASDSEQDDARMSVHYLYDLELNSTGEIIGGEWYRNLHPDFLWIPAAGAQPQTYADTWIDANYPDSRWDGNKPVPREWLQVIPQTSSGRVPVAKIVNTLSRLATSESQ